ncbi:MAG: hypothetical protein ACTS27_09560 [Phycisphaerales bacterium]
MSNLHRLKAELLADKKKASILGGLGAVALVLGARALLLSGDDPKPASSTQAQITPAFASGVPTEDAEDRLRALMSQSTGAAYPTYPDRDLFALREAYFPHPAEPEPPQDESAKSAEQRDEVIPRRPTASEIAAASLTLKSTLIGKRPLAVLSVSGLSGGTEHVVRVGDSVNGFSVVEIGAKRIVLDLDGERIELAVKDPLQ